MGLAAPLFLGSDEGEGRLGGEREPQSKRHLSAVGKDTPGESWENRVISVLVVEDDPAMQMIVTFNLEAAGFKVTSATTGAEALETVAGMTPDLALLDVMLPDVGGIEIAAGLTGIPIVFMSARATEADFARGRQAGAIDYVAKPFDPVRLPARLREDLVELDRGGSAGHVWALRFGSTP
jgi:CheY-like chemotaxis protein